MPDHLSVSQINLYLLCSLKYRFQYIDGLTKTFRPAAMAFGSSIHAALSWFHDQIAKGNGADEGVTLEKVLKIYEADWYAQTLDTEILFDRGQTAENLAALARELLGRYLAKPQTNAKASEVHFTVPLIDPVTGQELEVSLEGFFDLLTTDEGIVEFKTSGQTMTSRDADGHLQLTAYSYAYEKVFSRPPASLKIVDLVKGKNPKMVVLETMRTQADHDWFLSLAREVFGGIQNKVFFPRTGYWCRDCEFRKQCRAWKGN